MGCHTLQGVVLDTASSSFLDSGNLGCYNADTLVEKGKGAEGE
jgi:hypothetical protein